MKFNLLFCNRPSPTNNNIAGTGNKELIPKFNACKK